MTFMQYVYTVESSLEFLTNGLNLFNKNIEGMF